MEEEKKTTAKTAKAKIADEAALYQALSSIDVKPYIEKKGPNALSYLPWAKACDLIARDHTFEYRVVKFDPDGMETDGGFPFQTLKVDSKTIGFNVETEVTIDGITKRMWLPVMDNRNESVKYLNGTLLNKSIMRCMVKNIAMFGLGIGLYTGEDLPDDSDVMTAHAGGLLPDLPADQEWPVAATKDQELQDARNHILKSPPKQFAGKRVTAWEMVTRSGKPVETVIDWINRYADKAPDPEDKRSFQVIKQGLLDGDLVAPGIAVSKDGNGNAVLIPAAQPDVDF